MENMIKNSIVEFNEAEGINIDFSERLPYEIFLPITDDNVKGIYPGYFISNYSRVYSSISGKIIKTIYGKNKNTYPKVTLKTHGYEKKGKTVNIHRILMNAFYPDHDKAKDIVNHKDGIKSNSFLYNLEFTDIKGNVIHARDTGLLNPSKGESHCCAKINDSVCREICEMIESCKYSQLEISKKMNVSKSIVESIANGRAWKHISKDYDFSKTRNERISRIFTYDELINICRYFQDKPKNKSESLRSYLFTALLNTGIENITESKLNGIRKLYKKERWKFIWSNFNY